VHAPVELSFIARDGRRLLGTAVRAQAPVGAVVIASATGVLRRYYQPFAEYLAQGGLSCLCFDYRGIGGSADGPVRRERALLHQWGEEDLEGALRAWAAEHPQLPLLFLAHSVGGQLLGLCESAPKLAGALMVGSQSGYWRLWEGPGRAAMWLVWHLAIPAACAVGYLPMRLLRQGENLPAGVAREWARWGRHPDYVLCYARQAGRAEGYLQLRIPIRMLAIADDRYAPPPTVKALAGFYPSAQVDWQLVRPFDFGHRRIGHFGFFRRPYQDTLWAGCRAWLLERAAGRSSA
jgi:predicted alpha/beta hydrolase